MFADPIEVSNGQLESLRKAKYFADYKKGQMVNNYRPIQSLAGRPVQRSFNDSTPCTSGAAGVRAMAIGPVALLALALGAFLLRL